MPVYRPAAVLCGGLVVALATGGFIPAARPADAPPAPAKVRQVKITTDKAPDCSSLKSVVESVTRGCKTNDEKAIALYNFMLLTHYHQNYPGEKGGLGALKEINVYGWSLCGGLHTIQAALWREMGWEWRYIGWSNPGHTTAEAKYDGRWHYLDVFLRYYTWVPDPNAPGGRTIASQDDIKANPALVTQGLTHDRARNVYYHTGNRFEVVGEKANWTAPSFLSCGDEPGGILTGIKTNKGAGSPTGWAGLVFDSKNYSTDVNLTPGGSLTLTWEAVKGASWWNGRKYTPGHGCGDKDFRNCPVIGPILEPYEKTTGPKRSFSNGTLLFAPIFAGEADLSGLFARDNVKLDGGKLVPADPSRPGSITVELQSPYIITRASGAAEGVDSAEVSVDGGKTYKPVKLDDFSELVGGEYCCLVRLTFKKALAAPRLEAVVQCNRGSLPYLSPGKNKVMVAVADPKELGDNRLVVTYAYHPGFRSKSYEELADLGAELARAHYTTWADKPTVVQKVFAAKDLPAAFDIDVPTPKGKYPVYPRMVFVRREVVAPGAKPLPLPEGAVPPRVGPGDELKELPSPFSIGAALPPAAVVRPTTTRAITLPIGSVVAKDGTPAPNHFLKWKDADTWVLLAGGELKGLPPTKQIAAARLVVPVVRGHEKGNTKLGVTALTAAFEAGKPFDFKGLGEVVGTAVVPAQPASGNYSPPKPFAVDVTRTVKQITAGDRPFRGFGVRVVPDRSVDEGWTTRLDLPPNPEVKLELDVYDTK